MAAAYGVLRNGARRPGARHVTFVIDREGVAREVIVDVCSAEVHAEPALEAVRRLARR